MTVRRRLMPLADLLRRLVAGSSAALTLLLTVLVASPQLHDHVHHEDEAAAHDTCAVVLFGAGVTPAIDSAITQAPAIARYRQVTAAYTEIFVVAPRYLRQPERGPPLS